MNHKSKNQTNGFTPKHLLGKLARANRGPIQEAIWGDAEIGAFIADNTTLSAPLEKVLADSIACLQRNKSDGSLYGEDGKITQKAMDDLGRAGFWGVLVPTTYGGSGASFAEFTTIVSRMAAAGFATEAGIAGMHGCIGAVSSLTRNGSEEQKARYLPLFAAGLHTSGLALTEPGAGSDVMKVKTTAYRDGDDYVVSGEKLFNGNCVPGRIIRLVVMVDGEEKPAEFIVELPEENEHFQLVRYKILAVRQGRNNGLKFNKFRVPAANRIIAPDGNGLRLIYIGLNFGRVAVAANCAGIERLLLRSICPWANYRETYGQRIETRERVKAGIARLAALIVGTDALRNWCSIMLDNGETAELECIIAKTFAANALKEAAIDIALMIHGGRAFLGDHIVGANLHDYLAPCIYEGQNDMLNMKFFLTLGKEHIEGQLKPLNKSLTAAPSFALWNVKTFLKRFGKKAALKGMDARLAKHVEYALAQCPKLALEISNTMLKHGAKLGDRQSRVVALSQRVQDCIVMLVTASHAHSLKDEASIAAADVLCRDLKRKLTGEAASDADFAACNKLADLVIAGEFKQLHETEETPVLRPYKN